MAFFPASLSSLPPEIIEEIIIFSTLLGDPRAPSSFARTCSIFRALVYHQRHKHLWRELFLVLFDDPRPAIDVHTHGRALELQQINSSSKGKGKAKSHLVSHDFPWEDEYKLRIRAESFVLRRTQPPPSEPPPSDDAEVHTALDTLLRVFLTAAPLPYESMASHYHTHRRTLQHPHPIISPLLLAAHTQPSLVPGSRNTSWLARVLGRGLPRVLMARLTSVDENGNVDIQKTPVMWDGLLMKLVAQVGLMTPIKGTACFAGQLDHTESGHNGGDDGHATRNLEQEAAQDPPSQPQAEGSGEGKEGSNVDSDEVKLATSQRRLARVRVYNMAYIDQSRAYGPFLPLETHGASDSSPLTANNLDTDVVAEEEASVANTGSPSDVVPPVPPIPDANFDIDNADVPPPADDGGNDNDNDETQETVQEQETSGDAADGGEAPIVFTLYPLHSTATGLYDTQGDCAPSVQGEQLPRFDWAWIAAARQSIEFNLRDLLKEDRHQGVLRAFLSLDGLRSCSAPGFPPAPEAAEDEGEVEVEGGRAFRDGEGWDWAGVEGQWRRCTCWLDYRDLIGNNAKPLAERFSDPAVNEVMRIFPVTLRVTHYSPAHASWPGRPKIHFGGEMYLGSTSAVGADSGLRILEGTVQMAASGDVHWSILSYRDDGQSRWWSEAVQIGGLGSAMGFVGMWTSAEHQRSDPIGPVWTWKVGPGGDCPAVLP